MLLIQYLYFMEFSVLTKKYSFTCSYLLFSELIYINHMIFMNYRKLKLYNSTKYIKNEGDLSFIEITPNSSFYI